jgi:hypothetical protein
VVLGDVDVDESDPAVPGGADDDVPVLAFGALTVTADEVEHATSPRSAPARQRADLARMTRQG